MEEEGAVGKDYQISAIPVLVWTQTVNDLAIPPSQAIDTYWGGNTNPQKRLR